MENSRIRETWVNPLRGLSEPLTEIRGRNQGRSVTGDINVSSITNPVVIETEQAGVSSDVSAGEPHGQPNALKALPRFGGVGDLTKPGGGVILYEL